MEHTEPAGIRQGVWEVILQLADRRQCARPNGSALSRNSWPVVRSAPKPDGGLGRHWAQAV
jgi:hypothetical protein